MTLLKHHWPDWNSQGVLQISSVCDTDRTQVTAALLCNSGGRLSCSRVTTQTCLICFLTVWDVTSFSPKYKWVVSFEAFAVMKWYSSSCVLFSNDTGSCKQSVSLCTKRVVIVSVAAVFCLTEGQGRRVYNYFSYFTTSPHSLAIILCTTKTWRSKSEKI